MKRCVLYMGISFWSFAGSVFGRDIDSLKIGESDTMRLFDMPQITVLDKRERVLSSLPGSYQMINTRIIRQQDPLTINEIIRKTPGLHAVDEEGAGMRINIGVRGLDPDRSRNVLLLEDGIPIALNPYGEPEAYFSPAVDKISAIEVLKGSGQIMYGPQTIGGVINFITQDPPEDRLTQLRVRGGSGNLASLYASHGETKGNVGYLISALHKRADRLGNSTFNLTDISLKVKFSINEKNSFGLKIGHYREFSNSTYIGITQTMFDRGPEQDFALMAPDDYLPLIRSNFSLTHQYSISKGLSLKTTGFAYSISRNWRRQDFSSNPNASNQSGVIWGDPDVPGGAIYMLNTTGNRNRQFEVAGLESRLESKNDLFGRKNLFQIGARIMHEKAYEQFVVGQRPDASSGQIRDDEQRTGNALSLFLHNQIELSKNWIMSVGVRSEWYGFERDIRRGRFAINGTTQVRDTSVIGSRTILALIPGGGLTWKPTSNMQIYSGIHRGFAPPRVKDAITSEGFALELDPELSTNYEIGLRTTPVAGLNGQLALFYMDFENQIIPVSQSSGNVNASGFVNGGATRHRGVEFALQLELHEIIPIQKWRIEIDAALTHVNSKYSSDRFVGAERVNVRGLLLPYAPEWTSWSSALVEYRHLGIQWSMNYVGGQFTDEINSFAAAPNGRSGWIEGRAIQDIGIYYRHLPWNCTIRLNVKNITDERYIASRRPQGIRVGLPRMFNFGFDLSF